ncbi:hypothetical protein E1B28_001954 [Marasmius oreades]|uniref:Protein kinase domain-containing protein n=1 Tax=Marasmius oreades TaxID=181124 RepID=A0A9P7V4K3_9AGAR|nr:uncharacterized protein E1B28_001954 [Marasmius oreades]KAG7100175.1 hypothetical protein E1B28_001954 [Marasmius oreades]
MNLEALSLRVASWTNRVGFRKKERHTIGDLQTILSSAEGVDTLLTIKESRVPSVVNLLHTEIQRTASEQRFHEYRKNCTKCLQTLVNKYRVLPASLFVNDIKEATFTSSLGGYSDIYRGISGGRSICLKVLRINVQDGQRCEDDPRRRDDQAFRAFYKEALLWTQLDHPNLLPFLGVNITKFSGRFCLVSPWRVNGEITNFLRENPKHDQLTVITEIAAAMLYLHSLDIVHGDIKAANVLVDDHGHCQLGDFGLAAPVVTNTLITTDGRKGTIRWMAPELWKSHDYEATRKDKKAKFGRDIYAYAMTVLEIITGQIPFPHIKQDAAVIYAVGVLGTRPDRPNAVAWCPDVIWMLVQRCWAKETHLRPMADDVHSFLSLLRILHGLELPWKQGMPLEYWDMNKQHLNLSDISTALMRRLGNDGQIPSSLIERLSMEVEDSSEDTMGTLTEESHRFEFKSEDAMMDDIRELLSAETALDTLLDLKAPRIPPVLDLIQNEIRNSELDHEYRRKCSKYLRLLVNKHHVLPPSLFVKEITISGLRALAVGANSDIYRGTFGNESVSICLKVLRIQVEDDEEQTNRDLLEFYMEALLWTQLSHPNLLPFLGVNTTLFPGRLCLVSPWMTNGEITRFLELNPGHDKLRAVGTSAHVPAFIDSDVDLRNRSRYIVPAFE